MKEDDERRSVPNFWPKYLKISKILHLKNTLNAATLDFSAFFEQKISQKLEFMPTIGHKNPKVKIFSNAFQKPIFYTPGSNLRFREQSGVKLFSPLKPINDENIGRDATCC